MNHLVTMSKDKFHRILQILASKPKEEKSFEAQYSFLKLALGHSFIKYHILSDFSNGN